VMMMMKEPHLAAFLQARDGRSAMGMEKWAKKNYLSLIPSLAGRRRNHIWQHFCKEGMEDVQWVWRNGIHPLQEEEEEETTFGSILQARDGRSAMGVWEEWVSAAAAAEERRWVFAYLTETTPIFQSFFAHTDADHEDERGDETGSGIGRDGSESQSSSQEEVEIGNASELLEQSLGEEGERIVLGSGDVVVPVLVRLHCMSLCLVAEHHSRESFAAKKLLLIAAPQRLRPLETSPKCIELAEPHPHLLPASSSCHHLNSPTYAPLQSLLPEQKRSLLQHCLFSFSGGGREGGGSWVLVNLLPLQI
jgi:hypothetical protein